MGDKVMFRDNFKSRLATVFGAPVQSGHDVKTGPLFADYLIHDMRMLIFKKPQDHEHIHWCHEAGYYTLVLDDGSDDANIDRAIRWSNTVYWTSHNRHRWSLHSPQKFGDVGYDIAAANAVVIEPHKAELVSSGIHLEMPPTLYGWLTPRSSTARKMLMMPNGILDAGYRGELFAYLFNMTDETIRIDAGDRIMQVIFQRRHNTDAHFVTGFEWPTERGENGFGSTGV
mgnify:FL=1